MNSLFKFMVAFAVIVLFLKIGSDDEILLGNKPVIAQTN